MSLSDKVLALYRQGFKEPKQIKAELERQEPSKTFSLSSIRSYLSVIKQTQKDNNSSPSINQSDNVSSSPQPSSPEPTGETSQVEPQTQAPQAPAPEPTQENKPAGKLITGAPFKLEGATAGIQGEGSEIAKNYEQSFQTEATVDPKMVVYVDRIGEVSGKLTSMIFNLKPIQKFTHGYKIETKDAQRLDQDMSMMLKSRLPVTMSEYADVINIGIDAAIVGVKALFHRFETPLPEEFKDEAKGAEERLKETGKAIIEPIVEQLKQQNTQPNNPNQCQECNQVKDDLKFNTDFNKNLCGTCDYNLTLKAAQVENVH